MRIGTKSVLFGAHCFFIHPWFVALGWWRLYGFPWPPRLWIAFFVHDIGYWNKPNMEGVEGEQHPRVGADLMWRLENLWVFLHQPIFYQRQLLFPQTVRWWHFRRRYHDAHIDATMKWGQEVFYHSRFFARLYNVPPSRLCWADKLAVALEPWWLYYIRVRLSGEIAEFRHANETGKRDMPEGGSTSDVQWVHDVQKWCLKVAYEQIHAPART